jgi:hypothetical protein
MAQNRVLVRAGARAGFVLLAALCGACQLAQAKMWNLEQVHESDGSPKRRGDLRGDLEYVLTDLFERSNFGGADFETEQVDDERIDDPLGECLENLIGLGECERDERVVALQVSAFAWLAVDCTYVLSRERALIELGALVPALELQERAAVPNGEPATPEVVRERFEALVRARDEARAEPVLAGDELQELCAELAELPLDRPGALRLLRAASVLLKDGERTAVLAPLRGLRLELARRCTVLALREARGDAHGRPLAAALDANLRAFPDERAELLRWGLLDALPDVERREELSLRALERLAQYGAPPRPDDIGPEVYERYWIDAATRFLVLPVDGPHTLAACRALAKLTGEPQALRPEIWIERALDQRAAEAAAAAESPESSGASEPR